MNTDKYLVTCPMGCDSEKVETNIILPEGPLEICSNCGQYISQCSTKLYFESMKEFNDDKGTWPTSNSAPSLIRKIKKLLSKIKKISSQDLNKIKLLDVGCSNGAFIYYIQKFGVSADGVEPANDAARSAQQRGLNVYQGFLEDLKLQSESYDVITLFEVIEHLKDPVALLRECNRLLKKNGLMIIQTANIDSWTAKILKGKWKYLNIREHGGHISFFNKKSFTLLAEKTNFIIEKFYTHSVCFADRKNVPYAIYRTLKIFSEILNFPSKIFGKGHEMLIFLRKK